MFRRLPLQFRMLLRGRKEPFTALSVIVVILFLYLQRVPYQTTELAVTQYSSQPMTNSSYNRAPQLINPPRAPYGSSIPFQQGTGESPETEYTKAIVIARTKAEDISWLNDTLDGSDTPVSDGWEVYTYTTDDLAAPYHTPLNKGREAMAYLTYIIDHYYAPAVFPPSPALPSLQPSTSLPEVIVFMHAHRQSWHDNLFSLTSPATIARLRLPRVLRLGYMNLRCSWDPGCPDHIHPTRKDEPAAPDADTDTDTDIDTDPPPRFDPNKPEESIFASAWSELFAPSVPVPAVLSQPCCAQFAVSRARVLARPLAVYVGVRDWLLATGLADALSGRVLEYLWQVLWTGRPVVCPAEGGCYCEGYGICFGGGPEGFGRWVGRRAEWVAVRERRDEMLGGEVERWGESVVMEVLGKVGSGGDRGEGDEDDASELREDGSGEQTSRDPATQPSLAKMREILRLNHEIEELAVWLEKELDAAKERGKDPDERAKEADEPLLDILPLLRE